MLSMNCGNCGFPLNGSAEPHDCEKIRARWERYVAELEKEFEHRKRFSYEAPAVYCPVCGAQCEHQITADESGYYPPGVCYRCPVCEEELYPIEAAMNLEELVKQARARL